MVKKLTPKPDILRSEEITKNLKTRLIGKKVLFFKKITSTNLYAKQLVKDYIQEGTIVVADVQTHGLGRKNRFWHSPAGGLWFSVVLYPHIPTDKGMLITMASSVSVAQAFKEITGLNPEVKWPNDLLLNGKKVCGILTEIDADINKINYIIVGIGINVNNDIDEELKEIAISLKQEVGSKISRVKLLRSILQHLDSNYNKLIFGEFESIRDAWLSYSSIIGRKIQVEDEKNVTKGVVIDIDDGGYIILKTDSGMIRIISGDVKYL